MTSKAVTEIGSEGLSKSTSSVPADVKAGFLVPNHADLLHPFIILAEPVHGRQDIQRKASPSESKAAETDRVARGIIADETEKRDEKLRRLRAARLERNASEKPKMKPGKPGNTPGRKASAAKSAKR
ncbi:hypothetical protein OCH239_12560 [Roseivivax halodurans JCM 10272]|uniref:Uncharacterized protein n=1 Tax=Roseivivax halodurans JCM 10272 TaxID=1449350 RepID=X7EAZ5_9RHOB|nr:hypothetical protein [Roseivivax halodurans]ETX13259.1 hypothetical protein OCH239_12560 [Roseivivax halodurans JCM 10272]